MSKANRNIALVCPGGRITPELAEQVRELAASHIGTELTLKFHPQCFLESGHFAGTDAERSAAFLQVANDARFDAVWFARGGYGACRFNNAVVAKLGPAARNKIYLGYSDAGVLLARLYQTGIGACFHGPMPTDLLRSGGEAAIKRALTFLTSPEDASFEPTTHSGEKLAPFNITVLAHLIAGENLPDLTDHILLLEDVGEYLYRTDRSLCAILTSPKMRGLRGVKLGRLGDVPENDRPFGHSGEEIAQYWCRRAGLDYLGRADIGHDNENKIAPFGSLKTSLH